jgi:CRISPR/Cas system-associated exonuclease Cas4 (RecB family)
MVFGILVHKVMEEFITYVKMSKLPENIAMLHVDLTNQISRIFQLRMQEFNLRYPKALRQLGMTPEVVYTDYIETAFQWFMTNQIYTKNIDAEVEFSIPLMEIARTLPQEQLHPSYPKYRHILLIGKKDLTIAPDIIVDFKTHQRPDKAELLLASFQTTLYTLIEDRDMTFIYLYVKKPLKETRLKLAQSARLDKFNYIIEILDKLNDIKSYNKNPKGCGGCIFRKLCTGK